MTTRVFTRTGRVAHLRRDYHSMLGTIDALCGLAPLPWDGGWYGTGSQAEYDRADSLPTCKRCQRIEEAR